MSARGRAAVFWIGALGLAALLAWGFAGLPRSGAPRGAYGDLLVRIATPERKATDVVAAVNFDYRGIDTLGEEFILFASVAGVAMVLRRRADETNDAAGGGKDRAAARDAPPTSDAVRLLGVLLVNLTVVFGLSLAWHGQVTPGGGFQGGVVLATVPLAVYLSTEARTFLRIAPRTLVEVGEAAGAGGYAAVGLLGLAAGGAYLANVLPLGSAGDVLSSGTILVLNLSVALAVAGGFVVVLTAFLEETIERRLRSGR